MRQARLLMANQSPIPLTFINSPTMTPIESSSSTSPTELPDQVFHYTSIDTMMKIVDSRSIWCTALPYLNDSKERTFLLDAVKRRLPILKTKGASIDPALRWLSFEVEDVNNVTSLV